MQHMLNIRFADGRERAAAASPELSLLANLRAAGILEPESPCGGNGTCGKCACAVTGSVRDLDGSEPREVRGQTLRLCRVRPAGDCRVELPAGRDMTVVTAGSRALPGGGNGLGLAADIGTTTLAVYLYDLRTGALLASEGARNVQRAFGADVISRITACPGGGLEKMRDAIRAQIDGLALVLCRRTGRDPADIGTAAVAGNTVMEHLFDGLDPTAIGRAPFTPSSLFGDFRPAAGYFQNVSPNCRIYLCPALSGYVGGDITAGLTASGGGEAEGLLLYMDIGTNGEMALGNAGGYLSCATAAGPAFEGAQIACGMPGAPGAIDRVTIQGGGPAAHVLGGGEARGLCGSGLVDAVAVLLSLGAIAGTGRLLPPDETPAALRDRLFRGPEGDWRFTLADGVFLSALDIRQLQLAKAAIRAGAETLLTLKGRTAADVTQLQIAGGFGSFLRADSALRLGLLPDVAPALIRHVGNAAGAGAALALTEEGRRQIASLSARCEYHELSRSGLFMENYVACMAFDEEDD